MNAVRERIEALIVASEFSHTKAAVESTAKLLDDDNAARIEALLTIVSKLTPKGAHAYERVLEVSETASSSVANAVTLAWRYCTDLNDVDRSSLRPGAKLYNVHLDNDRDKVTQSASAVVRHLNDQLKMLRVEADSLEELRLSIHYPDTEAVSRAPTYSQTVIKDPLNTLLSAVPSRLLPYIKKTEENVLEMKFDLRELTDLQRVGVGTGKSEYLKVRLLYARVGEILGYCVHLSGNDTSKGTASHTPWFFSAHDKPPNELYCFGRTNHACYQVSRMLWRHLEDSFISLEDTWGRIDSTVKNFAQRCAVCGTHRNGARLLRPTTCHDSAECKSIFAARSLTYHVLDLFRDPDVFDLLLTMIHATSLTDQLFLLSDCPIDSASTLETLLDCVPPIDEFSNKLSLAITQHNTKFRLSNFLSQFLGSYASHASTLARILTWVGNSYGGFLTSATGPLAIPGFAKYHQFLLANASPGRERRFAAHLKDADGESRILFHGTTLDRLHSILRQGLLVCSGTSLERNGATFGDGVYMTPDPAKACDYAHVWTRRSWAYQVALSTGQIVDERHQWVGRPKEPRSEYQDLGVLLGCEVVGKSEPTRSPIPAMGLPTDLNVVADPTRIMVRYVFLVEEGQWMDEYKVVPAIQRVLRQLRAGEL